MVGQQQCLTENSMLGSISRILKNCKFQFVDGRDVISFAQKCLCQLIVPVFPAWTQTEEFMKFGNCFIVIALSIERVGQVIFYAGLLRCEPFGFTILGNGFVEFSSVVKHNS